MIRVQYNTEQLTQRWEDQRFIKNLMGKYANCIILNREREIFELFWSKEANDVCLGFNNGYYIGRHAVSGYYDAVHKRNELVAELLQKRFPAQLGDKSKDEIYGIGPFKVKPMACPVIEIAADEKTAKGLWFCQGAYTEVDTAGPVSKWTWGYFAADFIRENDEWKVWHLLYVNDVDSVCGQSWGKPVTPYPDLPEFEPLRSYRLPEPTVPCLVRELYNPARPLIPTPKLPEAYESFTDTFSYGI